MMEITAKQEREGIKMAIINTMTQSDFVRAFNAHERGDSWTRSGLEALYDHLQDYGDMELDIVGLDCEFCEYTDDEMDDLINSSDMDDIDDLRYQTTVLSHSNGYVINSSY